MCIEILCRFATKLCSLPSNDNTITGVWWRHVWTILKAVQFRWFRSISSYRIGIEVLSCVFVGALSDKCCVLTTDLFVLRVVLYLKNNNNRRCEHEDMKIVQKDSVPQKIKIKIKQKIKQKAICRSYMWIQNSLSWHLVVDNQPSVLNTWHRAVSITDSVAMKLNVDSI